MSDIEDLYSQKDEIPWELSTLYHNKNYKELEKRVNLLQHDLQLYAEQTDSKEFELGMLYGIVSTYKRLLQIVIDKQWKEAKRRREARV